MFNSALQDQVTKSKWYRVLIKTPTWNGSRDEVFSELQYIYHKFLIWSLFFSFGGSEIENEGSNILEVFSAEKNKKACHTVSFVYFFFHSLWDWMERIKQWKVFILKVKLGLFLPSWSITITDIAVIADDASKEKSFTYKRSKVWME